MAGSTPTIFGTPKAKAKPDTSHQSPKYHIPEKWETQRVSVAAVKEGEEGSEKHTGVDAENMLAGFCKSAMAYENSRSVKFQDDLELAKFPATNGDGKIKMKYKIDGTQIQEASYKKAGKEVSGKSGRSLKAKVLSRVFSEDYERVKQKILDPRGKSIRRWNKIFLVACLISLFVDPLFFYLPDVRDKVCMDIEIPLEVVLTIIRSIADIFYMIQIFVRFRTAYVAPSSRVFGRGELVIDTSKIALRYLGKGFWIDLIAALPLPQVCCLQFSSIQAFPGAKMMLKFVNPVLFVANYISVKATGVVTETAWAGAAYNLILYMLASHVLGACWYLLSIERQEACWRTVCNLEKSSCQDGYFDCHKVKDPGREAWFKSSNVTKLCDPNNTFYQFGIYADSVISEVTSSAFFEKYFYCLWWGLRNLSSLGQNLSTSTYVGEIIFAIIIATLGLVLFALLIGNMQTYLQSTTVRLEEWRIKRTDTEQWMHHRQLPAELKQSVRKYDQYKWVATRGVDEEALLKGLPMDLRRDIKRHLCFDLVRRVPLFDQMDERMLDAICERLKPALSTEGTFLVREGDPVNEMLFVIRGNLDSYTTNGGRTGFFNSCRIGPEDLKFVASQFRRLHSKQLRQKFRFYSPHWRTWAACFIQAAWRRFKRRKEAAELKAREHPVAAEPQPSFDRFDVVMPAAGSGLAVYAARLAASARRVPSSILDRIPVL
ncbi:Protein CNGC15c [Vitis vinifera]|uniref:Protein CNGC15c n=1 Tax=Vitis vinifera TaxID=29760 RepID=A0A438IKM9_VITVI|nr:Protein CNGC15c [Vitis vinifera]